MVDVVRFGHLRHIIWAQKSEYDGVDLVLEK